MKTFEIVIYETRRYTKTVDAEDHSVATRIARDFASDFDGVGKLLEDVDFHKTEVMDVYEVGG